MGGIFDDLWAEHDELSGINKILSDLESADEETMYAARALIEANSVRWLTLLTEFYNAHFWDGYGDDL